MSLTSNTDFAYNMECAKNRNSKDKVYSELSTVNSRVKKICLLAAFPIKYSNPLATSFYV